MCDIIHVTNEMIATVDVLWYTNAYYSEIMAVIELNTDNKFFG